MVESINAEVQRSEQSEYIELWELDLSPISGLIYHFIVGNADSGTVSWGGQEYVPFDIEAEGFEMNGTGPIAAPRIRFSTTDNFISVLIAQSNDLCGGKITRIKTYRKFLDGEPTANSEEYFQKDTFVINTKISENKLMTEFECTSPLDQRGIQLPRGSMVPYCRAIYRKRVAGQWVVYPSDIACPYAGSTYFTVDGTPTVDATQDKCSHLVDSGCKKRFPSGPIPFMGFPGVQKPTA